ncbi:hypothetical protein GQ457_16G016960 [Hibiscus cannabinus]
MIEQGANDQIASAPIVISLEFRDIDKDKVHDRSRWATYIYKISLNRWKSEDQSRVMYPIRDPTLLRKGAENIFIKNLDKGIDQKKALHDTFSAFGNILSFKLVLDPSAQSKGYGFVQFDNEESTKKKQ